MFTSKKTSVDSKILRYDARQKGRTGTEKRLKKQPNPFFLELVQKGLILTKKKGGIFFRIFFLPPFLASVLCGISVPLKSRTKCQESFVSKAVKEKQTTPLKSILFFFGWEQCKKIIIIF